MKLTKKEVERLAANGKIYSVGYCKAQHLLRYQNIHGYNSGVYGWNYDVYVVGDNVIITGYRPFKANKFNDEKLKKYEQRAEKILNNNTLRYTIKKMLFDALLEDFLGRGVLLTY